MKDGQKKIDKMGTKREKKDKRQKKEEKVKDKRVIKNRQAGHKRSQEKTDKNGSG